MNQPKSIRKRSGLPKRTAKLPAGIKVLRGSKTANLRRLLSGPDVTTSGGNRLVRRKAGSR